MYTTGRPRKLGSPEFQPAPKRMAIPTPPAPQPITILTTPINDAHQYTPMATFPLPPKQDRTGIEYLQVNEYDYQSHLLTY